MKSEAGPGSKRKRSPKGAQVQKATEKDSENYSAKDTATDRSKDLTTAGQDKVAGPVARGVDGYRIMERLDRSLPLVTPEWQRVEQLLMQFTEFGPTSLVVEMAGAIASYADDQARRGYVLGREDVLAESARRVA